jgi:aryl-alcohol dehydrogenase-like predicted oxidoreductase
MPSRLDTTSSIAHLEENVGAGDVVLSADLVARLDSVCSPDGSPPRHGVEDFTESR